ncbi:hypothetical protein MMB17_18895 [Methylobacterium organophilum]|uniref:hypothetical protein n=1 Tax=Methylobacterium organophilum TaxID=410 RepID=UPI001F142694|nr:hypothetical protein [Methylobacterium organophilum]UMY16723.1 hypothetical protein MMB17_18895 [Methylobacterium organophilum]
MKSMKLAAVLALCAGAGPFWEHPARAQDQGTQEIDAEPSPVNREQPIAVPDPTPNPEPSTAIGKFTFGGAFRMRYDMRFDDVSRGGVPKTSEHFSFDALSLKAVYDSDTIFGAAQYRFYGGNFLYGPRFGYDGHPGEVNFPMWAYIGLKLTPEDSLTVGMNQVPFGLTPYFSNTFLGSLGFVMGVEEVYNLGLKYAHVEPDFNYQFGFYPGANPNAFGLSRDSARYSTNVVIADSYIPFGTHNSEENMFVGRAEYFFVKNDLASLALGASLWHSDIYNFDTRQTGSKQLESVHLNATYGAWGFKAVYVRQDIDPRNPIRNDLLTVGGFDVSYNMATRGNFVSADISYKVADPIGPFTIVPYLNYSAYFKDRADFKTSERYTLGTIWTLTADPSLVIYTEGLFGRNDPYVGAGQYTSGLAMGGDSKWKKAFFVNIGYYF